MAITEMKTGNKSLAGNTEWSLTADAGGPTANTTDGVFQVYIDLSGMTAGEYLRIKIYEKVTSANTQREVLETTVVGVQSEPMWVSPSLILLHGWDITANSIIGGTIPIDWSIRQIA